MSDALVFEEVRKRYGRQEVPALDGLSFRVPTGSICGFVGPNGAGKTTAFSVVSGFLPCDSGRVDILGEGGFDPQRFKGRVGALPQDAELPPRHTPLELLTHLARLQGMRSEAARREAERVLLAVRLADRLNQPMLSLSHGMRRRVAVASALVGSPELVLLDEPMAGLDPVQARSLRDVLRACGGQQTLVVSSHDLDELERLCDWVVMIDRGRCVQQGAMEQVTGQGVRTTWTIGPGEVPMVSLREALPGHGLELKIGELEHQAPVDADLDATMLRIMRMLCDAGIAVREVRRGRRLEDQFVDVTRG